ncbi:uncharacterized protein LOC113503836 [Trichoplusia ni]|uniref:Uncharacterized protein LOC113503836 n=1 Tax=Trichoplusia ni TaxID=7111 RepID=A0A7E5WLW3_TRINI|nr:uncharacterized protein LOC113503836 [Trichoplusia ni]
MRVELPEFKRCICCVPLRYGLVFWGYFRFIQIIASFYSNVETIQLATEKEYTSFRFIVTCITIALDSIDFVINIIFIIGAHKKNVLLLKIYFYFSFGEFIIFCLLVIAIAIFFMYIYHILNKYGLGHFSPYSTSWKLLTNLIMLTGIILIQGYILLLVRSEIKKLSSNCQFRFVNNAAESDCMMQLEEGVENGGEGTKKGEVGIESEEEVKNDLIERN